MFPQIGNVGGSRVAHPPAVDAGRFGRSSPGPPGIVGITVDEPAVAGDNVGSMVKQVFFRDYPGFQFNVCFSVGPLQSPRLWSGSLVGPIIEAFLPQRVGARGSYGNPTSVWFNVFAGYYELVAPRATWTRPFGYEPPSGGPAIRVEDVVRLGKADWSYFSNYMYGVPADCVAPHDGIDLSKVEVKTAVPRPRVGGRYWDLLELAGVDVVSAYESDAPQARRLVSNSLFTKLWKAYFGGPNPQPGHGQSFPGATMNARLYMSYREDDDGYRTAFFGGTVNSAFAPEDNALLLDAEMQAVDTVITEHYPHLGFDSPA